MHTSHLHYILLQLGVVSRKLQSHVTLSHCEGLKCAVTFTIIHTTMRTVLFPKQFVIDIRGIFKYSTVPATSAKEFVWGFMHKRPPQNQ